MVHLAHVIANPELHVFSGALLIITFPYSAHSMSLQRCYNMPISMLVYCSVPCTVLRNYSVFIYAQSMNSAVEQAAELEENLKLC